MYIVHDIDVCTIMDFIDLLVQKLTWHCVYVII